MSDTPRIGGTATQTVYWIPNRGNDRPAVFQQANEAIHTARAELANTGRLSEKTLERLRSIYQELQRIAARSPSGGLPGPAELQGLPGTHDAELLVRAEACSLMDDIEQLWPKVRGSDDHQRKDPVDGNGIGPSGTPRLDPIGVDPRDGIELPVERYVGQRANLLEAAESASEQMADVTDRVRSRRRRRRPRTAGNPASPEAAARRASADRREFEDIQRRADKLQAQLEDAIQGAQRDFHQRHADGLADAARAQLEDALKGLDLTEGLDEGPSSDEVLGQAQSAGGEQQRADELRPRDGGGGSGRTDGLGRLRRAPDGGRPVQTPPVQERPIQGPPPPWQRG